MNYIHTYHAVTHYYNITYNTQHLPQQCVSVIFCSPGHFMTQIILYQFFHIMKGIKCCKHLVV